MKDLLELKSEYQLGPGLQDDDFFRRNKRLIFWDANMKFIQCEMINDMSRLAAKETEVAELTQCVMNGKIQFGVALRKWIALLLRSLLH